MKYSTRDIARARDHSNHAPALLEAQLAELKRRHREPFAPEAEVREFLPATVAEVGFG